LLLFVHECGHLLAAKRFGLKVSAPMFIPFLGAVILLKESPRNAWVESVVGIGGPLLGSLGALICEGLYQATGNLMFRGLAYSGFFLNLVQSHASRIPGWRAHCHRAFAVAVAGGIPVLVSS
jgi:Zn-dependent protease